jgi:hypothetical protein
MTGCHFNTSAHDGADVKPVARPLSQQVRLMCAGCRSATGWRVTERRVADVPVTVDQRRSFRPPWLDRLTARDETRRTA